jgi:hypothetical protein
VAVAVAAAGIVSVAALPVRATTTPGLLYSAKLVITADKITLSRDRFAARKGVTQYPRGSSIKYEFTTGGRVRSA